MARAGSNNMYNFDPARPAAFHPGIVPVSLYHPVAGAGAALGAITTSAASQLYARESPYQQASGSLCPRPRAR